MASALKRKRGLGEVVDTPKRAKSVKELPNPLPPPQISQTGWEAAFNPPPKSKELITTNGVNGDGLNTHEISPSPGAVDYESFVKIPELELQEENRKKEEWRKEQKRQEKEKKKLMKKVVSATDPNSWKLSDPIGGRQINVDPVFTADEQFIILADRSAIHVHSTENSLLTRSIKLKIDTVARPNARIVAYCLSPTNSSLIWVACSDGTIYSIDWTTGTGADQSWTISSTGCIHMTVASMESAGRRRDVVFTTEIRKDGGWRITANELAHPKDTFRTAARTIYTSNQRISFLKSAKEGSVIVAASEKRVLLGSLRSIEYDSIDKIRYEFRVFESTDFISSLDLKVSARPNPERLGKSVLKRLPVVDVAVGDVRGSIFVHDDLLGNLARSQDDKLPPGISLMPRKLHWHRKEVCTVKWSLDGNYIISGGTETVLVLWQLDTGKKQFLPHMSATIQNVVVSPSGTSYGIQLADNSAMVLSVAELKPTANIAGIQTSVLGFEEVVKSQVRRLEEECDGRPFIQSTPAVISPANPSHLLVGVSQKQEINPSNPLVSSIPYLQTFDLGSGNNISRQALTRSNETNINITPISHQISEPRVTHMKMSFDGRWLATVDEWTPPKRDLNFIGHQGKDLYDEQRHRREVYLKFWQRGDDNDTWELVSRVDAPHALGGASYGAGRVLDLAVDPSSPRFSTVGEDGIVRIWSTKTRKRDGVVVQGKDGQTLRNWDCRHSISMGKPQLYISSEKQNYPANGCVAFSEDGSLLAAACGNDGLLHLLDPESGVVRVSQSGLFDGDIMKAEFLGQDLITLSNKLQVYDVVSAEIRYSIKLDGSVRNLSMSQKNEMMHLAVDRKSRTFAVALPSSLNGQSDQSLLSASGELAVFEQDNQEPVLQQSFPNLITALLPAAGSDGYLVLDSSAELRSASRKGSQAVTTQAQSTSALQLDKVEDSNGDLLRLVEDEVEEVEDVLPSSQILDVDDEDDEIPVVTQQQLTEIFDIGPSFALPPMDELFYQVAGLFVSKPLAQSVT